MKKNLFYKIVEQWNELSLKEKIELLQKFEQSNAILQGRKAREIVTTDEFGPEISAAYSFDEPSIIKLGQIQAGAISAMDIIFHEGFHALCDDYFNNKADLKTFSHINKNRLHNEKSKINLIQSRANYEGVFTLFCLSYYEEELVRKETCLYQIYNLLSCCESKKDCEEIFNIFCNDLLFEYLQYTEFVKRINKAVGENYYKEMLTRVNTLDAKAFSHKLININTSKNILLYPQSEVITKTFEEGLFLFNGFQNKKINENDYTAKQLANIEEKSRELNQ